MREGKSIDKVWGNAPSNIDLQHQSKIKLKSSKQFHFISFYCELNTADLKLAQGVALKSHNFLKEEGYNLNKHYPGLNRGLHFSSMKYAA